MVRYICVMMMTSIVALGCFLVYYSVTDFRVETCTLKSIVEHECDDKHVNVIKANVLIGKKVDVGTIVNPCFDALCLNCLCNITIGNDYNCWSDNSVLKVSCQLPKLFVYRRLIPGSLMVIIPIVIFFGWLAAMYTRETISPYEMLETDPLAG